MRTLKKSLSLVLVLAMVFSFCAFGTSAAFADADKIDAKYAEAVEVMNALAILKGDDAGFRPDDTLTRAEACVIIIKMLGELDFAKVAKTDKFDDISGHWAEAYIAYCAEQGLISGLGDNKFGPDSELSGYAFALMVLRAVGYNPAVEGIGGADWELDTAKYAKKVGLIADMELISAETFTREMAAQMAFDGLMKLGQVTYTAGTTTTVNGVTVVTGSTLSLPGATLYAGTFGGSVVYGVVKANSASAYQSHTDVFVATTNTTDGTIDSIATATTGYAINTGLDVLGRVVKLYVTGRTDANGNVVTYAYTPVSSDVAVSATQATAAGTTTSKVKALFPANTALAPENVSATANYAAITRAATAVSQVTLGTGASDSAVTAGTYVLYAGEVVGYIAPCATVIETVTVIEDEAGKEEITLNTTGALANGKVTAGVASDVVNEYDGIAEGDYVAYVKVGAIYNLAKCTTVEGLISKVDAASGANVIVLGGKEYAASTATDSSSAVSGEYASFSALQAGIDFEETHTLYLDPNGGWFAVAPETPATIVSDIVYVVGVYEVKNQVLDSYGTSANFFYAQTIALDGTEGKYLIGVDTDDDDSADIGVDTASAQFSKFTLSATPAEAAIGLHTVAAAPSSFATTTPVYTATAKASTQAVTVKSVSIEYATSSKAYLTDDTIFLFYTGTNSTLKTEVVTGGVNFTIPASAKLLLTETADGNVLVHTVLISSATLYTDAGVTANDMYYIPVQSAPAKVATGYEYTVYSATTGEASTVVASNTSIATAGFYGYTVVDGVFTFGARETTNSKYGEVYATKYGTLINSTNLEDVEAGSAVIVDLRTAAQKTASGVDTLATLDAIAAAKAASKTVTFDCLTSATAGVVIIFVVGPTA